MSRTEAVRARATNPTEPNIPLLERVLFAGLRRVLGETARGHLRVTLPSGAVEEFGSGDGSTAELRLNTLHPVRRLLARGVLGLAESYMLSELDTADLGAVLRFCHDNYSSLENAGRGRLIKPRLKDALWHRLRPNTRAGSKRNIAAHYDLGNTFYAQWLDAGMTYSSALFRKESATLEDAQAAKYNLILDALHLEPAHRVLEVGCGWGGMAEAVVRRSSHVTAITVSNEQLAYAKHRTEAAGLDAKADIRFQDYRDVTGTFDRIVSVEMIEAVGEAHWPIYFQMLRDRLSPGGRAVLQAITIDECYFESYRRRPDFIQRYIFPGGMLPTVTRMAQEAARAGLSFETVERFGTSYAATLVEWRRRFRQVWPEIAALGFDERFRRMWEYYLIYCEVGFERGDVDVGVYRLTKTAS